MSNQRFTKISGNAHGNSCFIPCFPACCFVSLTMLNPLQWSLWFFLWRFVLNLPGLFSWPLGIDIPDVSLVLNSNMATSIESYTHRIDRSFWKEWCCYYFLG